MQLRAQISLIFKENLQNEMEGLLMTLCPISTIARH